MILLTDTRGFECAVNVGDDSVLFLTWEPDKESTFIQFLDGESYLRVQETPAEILALIEDWENGQDEQHGCGTCLYEENPATSLPCSTCFFGNEDGQSDNWEPADIGDAPVPGAAGQQPCTATVPLNLVRLEK